MPDADYGAAKPVACLRCGYIHVSTDARAVGRFGPTVSYVAAHGGPQRATRAEAEADECAWRQNGPSPAPVVRAIAEPTTPPTDASAVGAGDGQASAGEPFPAPLMETAARAKAWHDFLAQLRLSLMVWEVDGEVRAECEHVLVWLRRCQSELTRMGRSSGSRAAPATDPDLLSLFEVAP